MINQTSSTSEESLLERLSSCAFGLQISREFGMTRSRLGYERTMGLVLHNLTALNNPKHEGLIDYYQQILGGIA